MTSLRDPHMDVIALFDSGVGGLTVFDQIAKCLPDEHLIYFGDTARMPYGEKESQAIRRFSVENATFLMQQHPLKMLIVACNTAAAHSREALKQLCPFPVIDVIEAGVRCAVEATRNQRIAVLGTRSTAQSGIYEREIKKRLPEAVVTTLACPLLAPLVEEHFTHHPAARLIVREYLEPLKSIDIDTLLLGCTHYPLLQHFIKEEIGEEIAIVSSASSCAKHAQDQLIKRGLNRPSLGLKRKQQFYVSDDMEKFSLAAHHFLGFVPKVQLTPKGWNG